MIYLAIGIAIGLFPVYLFFCIYAWRYGSIFGHNAGMRRAGEYIKEREEKYPIQTHTQHQERVN